MDFFGKLGNKRLELTAKSGKKKKQSYNVENFKNRFKDFRKYDKKKMQERILGNYQTNYLTEFELYIDIVIIVYIYCAKSFS